MLVLGIETATQVCGIAVTNNKQLVGEYRLNIKNLHSERLVGAMEKLLCDIDIKPKELQGIAVSIGPGSFTGLRIGLSVAKGMAFSLDIPLTAVPTLEALAWQAPFLDRPVCAVLRARAKLLYAGRYLRRDDSITANGSVEIIDVNKLHSFAEPGSVIIGNGTELISDSISKIDGYLLPVHYSLLSGLTTAILGTIRLEQGANVDVYTVEPLYIQQFIAGKPKHGTGL